jgi:hypothetical protein
MNMHVAPGVGDLAKWRSCIPLTPVDFLTSSSLGTAAFPIISRPFLHLILHESTLHIYLHVYQAAPGPADPPRGMSLVSNAIPLCPAHAPVSAFLRATLWL